MGAKTKNHLIRMIYITKACTGAAPTQSVSMQSTDKPNTVASSQQRARPASSPSETHIQYRGQRTFWQYYFYSLASTLVSGSLFHTNLQIKSPSAAPLRMACTGAVPTKSVSMQYTDKLLTQLLLLNNVRSQLPLRQRPTSNTEANERFVSIIFIPWFHSASSVPSS